MGNIKELSIILGGGDILYVLRIDALKNEIIVGSEQELTQKTVLIDDINWLGEEYPQIADFDVKLRSRQNPVRAKISFLPNNKAEVSLLHDFLPNNKAEVSLLHDFFGAAPGQGCCFYNGTRVMGGGIITQVL